jgi:hypothetical protein
MSAEIQGKINLKILNLNHRFLFMVGRVCLTIGAVVALSGTDANAADVPGYACMSRITITPPSGCSGFTNTTYTWEGFWTVKCSQDAVFTGVSRCSTELPAGVTADKYEAGKSTNVAADNGRFCWCKLTSIQSETTGKAIPAAPWVYVEYMTVPENCKASCAQNCGKDFSEGRHIDVLFSDLAS